MKGEGWGGGVLLLNFEGNHWVSLLNFERVLGHGSQGHKAPVPGVLVPLLHHTMKLLSIEKKKVLLSI